MRSCSPEGHLEKKRKYGSLKTDNTHCLNAVEAHCYIVDKDKLILSEHVASRINTNLNAGLISLRRLHFVCS